ncbi:NAD-dependent succinate-semialdehyde dehydrogenase [Rhizobacter sp. Root1221]|uniref:NAD-dependent succinate-semialdehyde dehydrogenase n=1 Tax=Rhizobacter sp. Root1221 TaxID=1736433 RepID=UPI0006F688E0|nr:NAD-dependent succinate-semialdehyde dehydrogenase [Rhizobacter sp. Root1221]KQV90482.1 NAD-dependent succinate-semialdehyde dehydrogenase [Rhizobacter sp. Root1221]
MNEPKFPALALHVGGRWIHHASGGERAVIDPSDESPLGMLPLAGLEEIRAAAESAERGFRAWRRVLAHERYLIIRRAAQLMRDRAPGIARVLTLEQGKPLPEATREVMLSADIVDFQAEEGKRLYGRTVPPRVAGVLSQTVLRQPVGPVAAFTPWNFPANLPARKLGSALAAGCSVVIKPAEETPATCMLLVQCFLDAGVPPDALNMVCGDPAEVSATLIAHEAIRKVSITGSVAVGKLLGRQCAERVKRFTGELGGHAPVIVCEDADLPFALKASLAAKYRNAGQVCAAPIRFHVHRKHYAAWAEQFTQGAQALRLGPGLDPATQMGPLAHERRAEEMARFVADASDHGARVLCGGRRAARRGYFFEPTVIAEAPATSMVQRVEPFGPIAVIEPFDTLDDAITQANALPYALGAYAFTRDLRNAHRLAEEIDAGMVGINHFGVSQPELPFGGWKESGIGQEMGAEGLLHYTEIKTVVVGG